MFFAKIPPNYQSVKDDIQNEALKNVYSQYAFMYFTFESENESHPSIKKILNYLKEFKFITFSYSEISKYFPVNDNNSQKKMDKSNNDSLTDVIICIEKTCLIIERINKNSIQQIFRELVQKNNCIIYNVTPNDPNLTKEEIDALEEVVNFC